MAALIGDGLGHGFSRVARVSGADGTFSELISPIELGVARGRLGCRMCFTQTTIGNGRCNGRPVAISGSDVFRKLGEWGLLENPSLSVTGA